jgi:23S rRNA (adenine2503-C2)-methyltransferase
MSSHRLIRSARRSLVYVGQPCRRSFACASTAASVESTSCGDTRPIAAQPRVSLYGLPYDRLKELLVSSGFPGYRTDQVYAALYKQKTPLADITTLSKADRQKLTQAFSADRGTITETRLSTDGTRKWLLGLPGDAANVEMVYIPEFGSRQRTQSGESLYPRSQHGHAAVAAVIARPRATLCVSSQVGCSLSCSFCHTGTQKLQRNLNAEDIVLQYLHASQAIADAVKDGIDTPKISNVVFMGEFFFLSMFIRLH